MGIGRLALFTCGQLGMMALARFFYQWLTYFVERGDPTIELAASATMYTAATASSLFLVFRIFDAVTDPLAGTLSDAWVRRGHERRALLWMSFLIAPFGLVMIFAPPDQSARGLSWLLFAGGMFVFFVGYTVYAIPYWSLVDDYSQGDEHTRRWLSNMLGVGGLLATAFGFVVSPLLVERMGFLRSAIAFAIPSAALMTLPYFARPKGSIKGSGHDTTGARELDDEDHPPLRDVFKLALRDRRFRATLLLFAGAQMASTVMTASVGFLATDLLGGTLRDVVWLLTPSLVTTLVSFAAVPNITRKLGWERTLVYSVIALAVVYAGAGGLGRAVIGTPMVTAAILFALAGSMAAVLLGLEGEAIAACAQDTGHEVTSIYFGVFNFVVKTLNGVAMVVQGLLVTLASEAAFGVAAVRAMALVSGAMLVLGLVAYFIIHPRDPEREPTTATNVSVP